jgi:hypothetical protein
MSKSLLIPSTFLLEESDFEINYFHSNASLHENIYLIKRNSWEKAFVYILNTYFNVNSDPKLTKDKVTDTFKLSSISSNFLPCSNEITSNLKGYKYLEIIPKDGCAYSDLVLRRLDPFNYGEYLDFLSYLKSLEYSDDPAITKYHLQTLDNIAKFMLKFKYGNNHIRTKLKLEFRETQTEIEDIMNRSRNVLKLN